MSLALGNTSSILHLPSSIVIYCREAVGGLFSGCSYKACQSCPLSLRHFTSKSHFLFPSAIRLQPSDIFMNKERFHNALALSLGYQRIVNDKRINISIDDKRYSDDVMISISIDGFSKPICFRASQGLSQNDMDSLVERGDEEIKMIIDAVHHAYIQATTKPF